MEVSLFFEISIAIALICLYACIRYFYGTRIYYKENRYITLRELLLPLLIFAVHITSLKVLGFSVIAPVFILFALVSMGLIHFTQREQAYFNHRQYLHQLNAIVFVVSVVCYVGLHVLRFVKL